MWQDCLFNNLILLEIACIISTIYTFHGVQASTYSIIHQTQSTVLYFTQLQRHFNCISTIHTFNTIQVDQTQSIVFSCCIGHKDTSIILAPPTQHNKTQTIVFSCHDVYEDTPILLPLSTHLMGSSETRPSSFSSHVRTVTKICQ